MDRCTAGAIENRGFVANWDEYSEQLTIHCNTQSPAGLRNSMASWFKIPEQKVRVIVPFVGGAFGPKVMTNQPEEVLCTFASIKLHKPIKWLEDRQENFIGTTAERVQVHDCDIAFNKDGKILGFQRCLPVRHGCIQSVHCNHSSKYPNPYHRNIRYSQLLYRIQIGIHK